MAERPTSRPTAPSRPRHDALRLNGDYTFDHFVVGPSNRLSHAASLAVVDQPGEVYNPLFVHGGLGLGKTHLLQAICHELLQRDPTRRILYLPCEQFINQFISALERNTIDAFRERYRRLDVLVIDDIHFLANKDHSQEEFFHTFNALYNEKRQIILSSDSPPAEIPQIEERLVSRFAWGFVAKIEQPTYETRLAIIRKKAQRSHSDLPDEVAEYLAGSMGTLSIREIEGLVTRLLGSARLMKCAIDLETARDLLKGEIRDNRSRVTIEQVVSEICETYGVRLSDLQSKKRHQSITQPRQAAMHLLRRFTTMSLSEIGGFFGGRDHTTVIYALDKVKKRLETDPEFRALLEELVRRLER